MPARAARGEGDLSAHTLDSRTLTYWKAWGLLALSCILFGRIGGGGSKSGGSDRKRKQKLRSYLREQYEAEKAKSGCAGE